MKKLFLFLTILTIVGCEDSYVEPPQPCISCEVSHRIDTLQHPGTTLLGDYWCVEFSGINYFQIISQLDSLHPNYVINGVPLVEVVYDSDMWYVFDTLSMNIPLYSPFTSQYTSPDFSFPLPIGDTTYYITNPNYIVNSVGYTYGSSNFVKSYHTYQPRCEVLVFEEIIGDTIEVYIKTRYNYDLGPQIEVLDTLNVIIK